MMIDKLLSLTGAYFLKRSHIFFNFIGKLGKVCGK